MAAKACTSPATSACERPSRSKLLAGHPDLDLFGDELDRLDGALRRRVNADRDFPTEEVLRRIEERAEDSRDAIVRLAIETSPEHERDLRQDEIRHALAATKPAYQSVITQVARRNRAMLGDQSIEQMTSEQALRLYLQNRGVTPERTELLVKYYRQMDNAQEEC